MKNIPKIAADGFAWFINEDGVPYEYDASQQERDFPNDFHTAYVTEDAAWAAAPDSTDDDENPDDRALLNRALNCAVEHGVITDSEADHLEQKLLPE